MSEEPQVRHRTRRAVKLDEPALHGHDGSVLVTRTTYGSEEEVVNEKVRVPLFTTDPARITVGAGVTRNQGDYNSSRIDVRVELPCYAEASEIERAYQFASGLVDRYLSDETFYATGKR